MRLLVDTQTLLWFYWADSKLSAQANSYLVDPANSVLVSPASYWEIAIKMGVGKLKLSESYDDFIQHAIIDNGFAILPIEPRHASALLSLPRVHKDPFDRLLIAQAVSEGLPIVSSDASFDQYPVKRLI